MNIVICDDIEQYCKEIDKIIWNMADEFEEHIKKYTKEKSILYIAVIMKKDI